MRRQHPAAAALALASALALGACTGGTDPVVPTQDPTPSAATTAAPSPEPTTLEPTPEPSPVAATATPTPTPEPTEAPTDGVDPDWSLLELFDPDGNPIEVTRVIEGSEIRMGEEGTDFERTATLSMDEAAGPTYGVYGACEGTLHAAIPGDPVTLGALVVGADLFEDGLPDAPGWSTVVPDSPEPPHQDLAFTWTESGTDSDVTWLRAATGGAEMDPLSDAMILASSPGVTEARVIASLADVPLEEEELLTWNLQSGGGWAYITSCTATGEGPCDRLWGVPLTGGEVSLQAEKAMLARTTGAGVVSVQSKAGEPMAAGDWSISHLVPDPEGEAPATTLLRGGGPEHGWFNGVDALISGDEARAVAASIAIVSDLSPETPGVAFLWTPEGATVLTFDTEVTDVRLSEENLLAAVDSLGILVLPLDGGEPFVIPQDPGRTEDFLTLAQDPCGSTFVTRSWEGETMIRFDAIQLLP
ncbi:MAG: hypothetical protein Q4G64_00555 [bacterium]|nr:hypothetical protein [bacterium]